MTIPEFQIAIWVAGAAAEVLLLIQVCRSRLYSTFPFLTVFLVWQLFSQLPAAVAFRMSTRSYFVVFWVREVIYWLLLFLVILELYDHAMNRYSGLRRLARRFIPWVGLGLLGAAGGVVLFAAIAHANALPLISNWLYLMRSSIRLVHAGFLSSLFAFLLWFHVGTSRVVRAFLFGLLVGSAFQFALAWSAYNLASASSMAYISVSLVAAASHTIIVWCWCWVMWKERMEPSRRDVVSYGPRFGDEQLVLARLEFINTSLMKAFQR